MKYKYTNEHIQKKLREYVIAFRITIGMILLGVVSDNFEHIQDIFRYIRRKKDRYQQYKTGR